MMQANLIYLFAPILKLKFNRKSDVKQINSI